MNALAERVRSVRSTARTAMAIGDPDVGLTNGELINAARDAVAAVRRLTSNRSPMVAVTLPLSVDAIVMLVAAIIGDHSVCLLDPAAPQQRRNDITAAVRPDVIVDEDGCRTADQAPSESASRPVEPGYVAMSSGSTGGGPKGVLSTWSTIAAFAPFGAEALALDRDGSWAEISHPAYDMAITNLLVALASGAAIHVSSSLGDRVRPLRFIDRVQATHVRLAPRFIDLAAAERRPFGKRALRVWASGGDRLLAAQARLVFEFGVPALVNTYGTSETAGFGSAAWIAAGEPLATVHGSVAIGSGEVGPWRVKLVPHGTAAMLAIQTPHRPTGYLFGQSTGVFPRWEGRDVVLTGDVGAQVAGDLFCLGRAGRRVKRNATFVDLDGIDATIRNTSGVVSFTVVSADGTLSSLVEIETGELDRLRRALRSSLSPDILPDRLLPVSQLPRLGNGKVDHVAATSLADSPPVS